MHIILPKERPKLYKTELEWLPLFFLAGPIRGGGDWQKTMSEMLEKRIGRCIIANPSRYEPSHPHYQYKLGGAYLDERQTDWERHYLVEAARTWRAGGCVIFWLPKQMEPRDDGDPYARDTYGELGEWRGRLMFETTSRVVIGAEPEFPGLRVIKRNFEEALGSGFTIFGSMEDVVEKAATYIRKR